MKYLKPLSTYFGALFVLSLLTTALAHATIVLGTLQTEPAVPQAGEPFTLRLELEDPTQVPVEDAWVMAEFRPAGAGDAESITARFEETETAGLYTTAVTLPGEGAWELLLRDQTFRQEEATATVTLNVGAPTDPESLSFLFPPTATGPRSLWGWLIWLIGVPVLAGIVVTVLVLNGGQKERKAQG